MASEQERNKALVLQMYDEVWNKGNFDFITVAFAPNFKDHPGNRYMPLPDGGRDAFVASVANFRQAMPDCHDQMIQTVSEQDRVVYLGRITGTHTGSYMQIPASGHKVTVMSIDDYRLENGKIVERWSMFDVMGLMQQMGAMPGGH